ncbi:MAG: hypothetical protein H6Q19_1054 [Bacteroidetes bacterium]|nr:hypothetical protein [Bacteroidota bacterium]
MNGIAGYVTKEGFGIYVHDKITRATLTEECKTVQQFIDTYGLSALQIGLFLYSEAKNEFLKVTQVCVNFKDRCIGVYLERTDSHITPLYSDHTADKVTTKKSKHKVLRKNHEN